MKTSSGYLNLFLDTSCVPLKYQCYIILVNEDVLHSTSHAYFISFLFTHSYVSHLHWSMLYNIDISMVHKWFLYFYRGLYGSHENCEG